MLKALLTVFVLARCMSFQKTTDIKCSACLMILRESEKLIQNEDPSKTLEVGSFRVDPHGNQVLKSINYARSEINVMEVTESICTKNLVYVLGEHPITKKRGYIPRTSLKSSAPEESQNNYSLSTQCHELLEDYSEEIVDYLRKKEGNEEVGKGFCYTEKNFCQEEDTVEYDENKEGVTVKEDKNEL
uniref:DUF3456 domain-containing protein n=1 Tax=Rhabditophanes sp. KR3021 TaxID=114890 RepID=A0AC35TTZ3_9BILA